MSGVVEKLKTVVNQDPKRFLAHTFPGFLLFVIIIMAIDAFADVSNLGTETTFTDITETEDITQKSSMTNENKIKKEGTEIRETDEKKILNGTTPIHKEKTTNIKETKILTSSGLKTIYKETKITEIRDKQTGNENKLNHTVFNYTTGISTEYTSEKRDEIPSNKTVRHEINQTILDTKNQTFTFLILSSSGNYLALQIVILMGIFVGGILGIVIDGIGHYTIDHKDSENEPFFFTFLTMPVINASLRFLYSLLVCLEAKYSNPTATAVMIPAIKAGITSKSKTLIK